MAQRHSHPDWHNAPVPSFGPQTAELLVVGLAPGLRGANRTGRPFTGDFAGDLLYATLLRHGLAAGAYAASPDDGLALVNCRVTNAVRCVPPQNRPTGEEIALCRPFLTAEIGNLSGLKAILLLGHIAHDSCLRAIGARPSAFRFRHGALHETVFAGRPLLLADSYHCSRYNTNTRRLTEVMFDSVIKAVVDRLRLKPRT
jgi:uracil-DNA glycosylase